MNYSKAASHDESWQRSGWGSAKSQESRFKLAKKFIETYKYKGANLLDFGCNDGALQEYLLKQGLNTYSYIGFDLCKEAIENFSYKSLANAISYTSYESLLEDYESQVDIVICIGVLQILEVDMKTVLTQIDDLVHNGSLLLLSCLSLDWKGFTLGAQNTPNPSNRWYRAEEIMQFMNSINFKLVESCSILPREGTYGDIGYGYDMFLLFQKNKCQ